MKYIVVTGGVVSGLGKGVTISSVGRMLQGCGLTVTSIKIDPYLNVDAGTMSPFEHGEVFVLGDGGEADLDLGNYERFLSVELTSDHNITTGKIYRDVIGRERRGDYLGKTVQVVPHITNEIQDWIERVAHVPTNKTGRVADVCLIEVGGTVGDIESMVFLEALRQFQFRVGSDNFCLMFVSLVPVLGVVGEQKELRSLGLTPSVILCRSSAALEPSTKNKISGFCHVHPDCVLSVYDVNNIYHVPLLLIRQNLHHILIRELHLDEIGVQVHSPLPSPPRDGGGETAAASPSPPPPGGRVDDMKRRLENPDMVEWAKMAHALDGYHEKVVIALIGKYTGLQDSYLSVIKALRHASMKCNRGLEIVWIDATHLEDPQKAQSSSSSSSSPEKASAATMNGDSKVPGHGGGDTNGDAGDDPMELHRRAWEMIRSADGVVVPGGFGNRGFIGKTLAAKYCRTSNKPFLGICLGFQAMVVEFARNILKWDDANSTEFDTTAEKNVVIFMPEIDKTTMGGTMRLGARDTKFTHPLRERDEDGRTTSTSQLLYRNQAVISERHRHRYEVNPDFVDVVHDGGLKFVGRDAETGTRMEVAELPGHKFYVGCQYHPEFQSRPLAPSPLFLGLILASCGGQILEDHLSSMELL